MKDKSTGDASRDGNDEISPRIRNDAKGENHQHSQQGECPSDCVLPDDETN
jgi:hypothetical protein